MLDLYGDGEELVMAIVVVVVWMCGVVVVWYGAEGIGKGWLWL